MYETKEILDIPPFWVTGFLEPQFDINFRRKVRLVSGSAPIGIIRRREAWDDREYLDRIVWVNPMKKGEKIRLTELERCIENE